MVRRYLGAEALLIGQEEPWCRGSNGAGGILAQRCRGSNWAGGILAQRLSLVRRYLVTEALIGQGTLVQRL
jgi:hypothetical protein